MTAKERPVIATSAWHVTSRVVLAVLAMVAATSCGSEKQAAPAATPPAAAAPRADTAAADAPLPEVASPYDALPEDHARRRPQRPSRATSTRWSSAA